MVMVVVSAMGHRHTSDLARASSLLKLWVPMPHSLSTPEMTRGKASLHHPPCCQPLSCLRPQNPHEQY